MGWAIDGPRPWTLQDAVFQAQRDWPGPRCHHGMALMPHGPDLWCGRCEAEQEEEAWALENELHHRQTGRWMVPLGPHRHEAGLPERGEPCLLGEDAPF